MGFAARAVVEALPGPAAIVDSDGLVLVANRRWDGTPEGERLIEPPDGRVTALEADCGAQRRLVTLETAGPSRFLALLGHEVRTPVTTAVAVVDLLRAQPLEPDTRAVVDDVHRSVHALKNLTDDLLDLARLEAGALHLERAPTELRAVLESVVEPLQDTARRKGLLLLAAPEPDLPAVVFGDAARLRQVLTTVVGNAVKFTESGEVVVTAARSGADAYVITVADTGPGVADEDLRRIFAPFQQADSSAARRHEGAGLGLALAARLVERMGGTIDVRSTPGAGSEFAVRLPLDAVPAEPAGSTAKPLAGRRIAVAAPTPRSELALSWLLAEAGAEPIPVAVADLTAQPSAIDTLLWCDDAHDPEAVRRADAVLASLGSDRRALMISVTDPRTGLVRRPPILTAPLTRGRLLAALNRERTGVRGAPITVPELPGGRVLLAEDNDVNRTVFRRMIELLGVACDTVAEGAAAVRALQNEDYDVVLMDLQMPGTDGLTATRTARAAGCRTPILALTATALHGDRERCLAAGMDGHLSKPITLPELRAALAPYLTEKEPPPPDFSALHDLEEQLADRELVMSTVQTFLEQLDGRRTALADAVRASDHAALRAVAHTLKSSSGLLGASALSAACARAERDASGKADLAALVAGVDAEVDGAVRVLNAYLTGVPL